MVGPIRMASDFLAVPRRGAPSFDIGPARAFTAMPPSIDHRQPDSELDALR